MILNTLITLYKKVKQKITQIEMQEPQPDILPEVCAIYRCKTAVTTGGCCAGLNRTTQHRGRFKGRNVLLAGFGTQVGSPEVGKQIQTGNRQENSCRAGRGQKHE